MKIIKRIITGLVTVILVLILSFNLYNFISINILGKKLPTINGYAVLEVISGSMEPNISIGDMVIIDTKIKNYKEKDIVTFLDTNGKFVTHRILEINKDSIITKGDANNTIDDPIDEEDILGRYVSKITGIGALIKSFRSPFTMIMILVIGILLCVLVSIDSNGNVKLTKEEIEYMEFLEFKKKDKKDKKQDNIVSKKNKITKKEPTETKSRKTEKNVSTKDNKKKTNSKETKKPVNKKEVKQVASKTKKQTKEKVDTKTSKKTTTKKEVSKKETKSTTQKNEAKKPVNKKEVKQVTSKTAKQAKEKINIKTPKKTTKTKK